MCEEITSQVAFQGIYPVLQERGIRLAVSVPVRTSLNHIGEAIVLCARTRPKYIGGSRAVYQN